MFFNSDKNKKIYMIHLNILGLSNLIIDEYMISNKECKKYMCYFYFMSKIKFENQLDNELNSPEPPNC